jgi:hypothetical protein
MSGFGTKRKKLLFAGCVTKGWIVNNLTRLPSWRVKQLSCTVKLIVGQPTADGDLKFIEKHENPRCRKALH